MKYVVRAHGKMLGVGLLLTLIASASVWAWYRHAHPRIDEGWRTRIYPDYDEDLTLKRADGQEFNVDLSGVKMRDGTVVPYDIGLLSDNDPPLSVYFEDVHYVDGTGKSFELIAIDDPQGQDNSAKDADASLGPVGRRIRSMGKFIVLTDRSGIADFGKNASFVPTLAGGGTNTEIEIVTPYSLVKRVKEAPVENPF